jgi:hypothetical protein
MNAYDRAVLESLPYYEELERKARAEFAREKRAASRARTPEQLARRRELQAKRRLEADSAGNRKARRKQNDRRCAAFGCSAKATTWQGLCPRCIDRLRYEALRLKEGRSIETEERREEAA